MVAQPVFTDAVDVLASPDLDVSRAESAIEPTTDLPASSFDEPAELLSSVAMKVAIRVDQPFRNGRGLSLDPAPRIKVPRQKAGSSVDCLSCSPPTVRLYRDERSAR